MGVTAPMLFLYILEFREALYIGHWLYIDYHVKGTIEHTVWLEILFCKAELTRLQHIDLRWGVCIFVTEKRQRWTLTTK